METENKKKPGFDKRITAQLLLELKEKFRSMPGMSHEARARMVKGGYPQFSASTLEDYSRICVNVCEDVIQMAAQGKISITSLAEFAGGWDEKTQKFMAQEYVEKKLTPSILRKIKQLKREHSMGFAEAISRATGEIPADQPRKEQKKSLDQILTQIADMGSRFRALVSMALEMVGDEEAAAGVHHAIFEKVFILRQLVGDQYDFINSKAQRVMNALRKRVKEGSEAQQQAIGGDVVTGGDGSEGLEK